MPNFVRHTTTLKALTAFLHAERPT